MHACVCTCACALQSLDKGMQACLARVSAQALSPLMKAGLLGAFTCADTAAEVHLIVQQLVNRVTGTAAASELGELCD